MTDEFDDLKRALDAAAPKPDATRKAETLARAMENFDKAQGMARQARPTSDRPGWGLVRGVGQMFAQIGSRGALVATTAVAALAMVALVPALRNAGPEMPGLAVTEAEAPVRESVVVEDLAYDGLADTSLSPAPAPTATLRKAAPAESVLQSSDLAGAPSGSTSSAEPRLWPDRRHGSPVAEADTEAFPEVEPNGLKVTIEEPVSTFSIDVDTASWSIIRNSIANGFLPPRDAVRIEEMVNYFPYAYPAPDGDVPFRTSVGMSDTPWRDGTRIVQIGLQGAMPAERPPLNLVFLIDTSGSMDQPNKLPLLKQSFRLLLGELTAQDEVSIVTYAGSAGQVLPPTSAADRDTILAALDRLSAGGGTAGQEGLQQAYATARGMAKDGEVSRVILATDGDFNIGISDPGALEDYIATERDSGTYLSVLGFGRGNLDDATMQALAQTGNGMAAYIDTLAEAQKVLVDQLTGALVPIADDVKIQVEWNPAMVAEYRLLGYETRALRREDFNNDRVDAGEIGAGHQVTALYEITPVGSPARLTDPLRYAEAGAGQGGELGYLRLRYKAPGAETSQLIETPILPDAAPLPDARFAMAIAGFGQILSGSEMIGDWSFGDAIALALQGRGEDPYGYRQEAITLMRLAGSLMR
ncbi:VWA domain-containing protein [Thalassococcus sp. CAU 1522]|uniref:VWA domain-containing protein n=1 Tax=Thalassococcus arenae TaxID=2851652 RepID=A0ABS6N7D7_9RHOB|nr:VWA domain-containing protein [Thalassococcus arenae]MBV2359582.1 VWA domain-containing protein [Thalassococcus arenae]